MDEKPSNPGTPIFSTNTKARRPIFALQSNNSMCLIECNAKNKRDLKCLGCRSKSYFQFIAHFSFSLMDSRNLIKNRFPESPIISESRSLSFIIGGSLLSVEKCNPESLIPSQSFSCVCACSIMSKCIHIKAAERDVALPC